MKFRVGDSRDLQKKKVVNGQHNMRMYQSLPLNDRRGPEVIPVPTLFGQSETSPEEPLQSTVKVITESSEDIPTGNMIPDGTNSLHNYLDGKKDWNEIVS